VTAPLDPDYFTCLAVGIAVASKYHLMSIALKQCFPLIVHTPLNGTLNLAPEIKP